MNSPTTHAVLVGIDGYPGPEPAPLGGCVNDIDAIQRLLLGPLAVDPASITRLTAPLDPAKEDEAVPSRPPTRRNIEGALRALADGRVEPGDRVFIYYSGHGASLRVEGAQGVILREALVPVDTTWDANGAPQGLLLDVEFNELLRRITEHTDQVTVILDCCHSAGATRDVLARPDPRDRARALLIRGTFPLSALGLDGDLSRGAARDAGGLLHGAAGSVERCVVAAACLAGESAMEGEHEGGLRGGYFTGALVRRLAALDPKTLGEVRWGQIWRQLEADVLQKKQQHPRLLGSYARQVFGSRPEHGDTGFAVTFDGVDYRLDAGELAGVTRGARVAVYGSEPVVLPSDLGSEEEARARKGVLKVTEARPSYARAVLADGQAPFDLPPCARARVIQPGEGAHLLVALDPADAAIQAELGKVGSGFARLAESGETPAVVLKRCEDGGWAVTDDLHGTGESPGEPWLVKIPAAGGPELVRRVLEHYALYIAPVEMARRCQDLPAGMLQLALLDCSDMEAGEDEILIDPALDPQDPALPRIVPGEGRVHDVVEDHTFFCVEVRNNYARPLFVTLIEAGASGRVNMDYGGDVEVPAKGRHVFWLDATPKCRVSACVADGKTVSVDRLVAIGTTARDKNLSFLKNETSFRDVLDGKAQRDTKRFPSMEKWTSDSVIVRVRKQAL